MTQSSENGGQRAENSDRQLHTHPALRAPLPERGFKRAHRESPLERWRETSGCFPTASAASPIHFHPVHPAIPSNAEFRLVIPPRRPLTRRPPRMKRRHFLGLAASSASTLVCRGQSDSAGPEPTSFTPHHLLQILRDPELVRQLGRRYRELNPAEDNAQILLQIIGAAAPGSVFADTGLQLETALQRDFAAGRTVVLDGWLLAVTEARQCALYSQLRNTQARECLWVKALWENYGS